MLTALRDRRLGERGRPRPDARSTLAGKIFFGIMRIVVKVAPIGAFGAMAFTVGATGSARSINLWR